MKFIKEDEKKDYGILDEYGAVYSLDEREVIGFEKEYLHYCKIKNGCEKLRPPSYKDRFVIDNIYIPSSLYIYEPRYMFDDFDDGAQVVYIRKSFKVSDCSRYFSDNNGILFDKEQKTLLECPYEYECTEYTIPIFVSRIAQGAFENNKNLESLIIPRNVKWVERKAFYCCKKLNKVMITSDFITLEDEPFGQVEYFTILADGIHMYGPFFYHVPTKIIILTNHLYSFSENFLPEYNSIPYNNCLEMKKSEIVVPVGKVKGV